MPTVDFYLLSDAEPAARDQFACRLANKAFHSGMTVYLHTVDAAAGAALDQLLWSFRPSAFVPHALLGQADSERVAIGWGDDPGAHCGLLINLRNAVPAFVERFERVAEVVVQDPTVRAALRQSWKHYKDRGYPLRDNKL